MINRRLLLIAVSAALLVALGTAVALAQGGAMMFPTPIEA